MDAARIVAEAERSMGRNRQPENVVAEAWQAYELTDAISRLLGGGGEDGAEGDDLGRGAPTAGCGGSGTCGGGGDSRWSASRAGPQPVVSAAGAGPSRAARLTAVRDPTGTLRALRVLLGEIGLALVGFIGAAVAEEAYWQYIEALDAVDEAKDRVRALTGTHPG